MSIAACTRRVRDELHRVGWVLAEHPTAESLLDFAKQIGQPVAARLDGQLPEVLVPRGSEAALPRSLSALHGLAPFPFHTDAAHHALPPDLLAMRLAPESTSRTPTLLLDVWDVAGSDLAGLRAGTWLVSAGRRRFYAPMVSRRGSNQVLRFDPGCMRPVSTKAMEVQLAFQSTIQAAVAAEVDWNAGTVLVVDNWRCLHARGEVLGFGRALERVLVRSERSFA